MYMNAASQKELITASVYLPYDADGPPPTTVIRDIIYYCSTGESNAQENGIFHKFKPEVRHLCDWRFVLGNN
jgi:hypothetical protein